MKKVLGSGSAIPRLLSPSACLPRGAPRLESLCLFLSRAQRRGAALSADAYLPFLSACRPFPSLARQAHALMLKSAADLHPATATSLLDLYGRRGFLRDALRVFDGMPLRDPIAWNALLSCFLRQGLAAEAVSAVRRMTEDGVALTGVTLSAALKACASLRAVRLGKQIHARVVRQADSSLVTSTSLIDFYSACGSIQNAFDVFAGVDCEKDAAIYNSLIGACIKNRRFEEAFSILRSVRRPNAIALTCAFSLCSERSNLLHGKQAHCAAIRHGFESDTALCNAIVDMYAKCGALSSARLAFERIHLKNVVSWTSIIDAYGSHGRGVEAWNLFKKMEEEEPSNRVSPNAVTFLSLLSACGHSGLVEEGRESFFAMGNKYGIHPGPEHYSCFIYLLGRAGRIEEAWRLYGELSRSTEKLTGAVCIAMLNACKANMDLAKGEQVAEHLLELDDGNPASYILLSNFYAAAGEWDKAESSRREMRNRQLKKEVGNSQFDVRSHELQLKSDDGE